MHHAQSSWKSFVIATNTAEEQRKANVVTMKRYVIQGQSSRHFQRNVETYQFQRQFLVSLQEIGMSGTVFLYNMTVNHQDFFQTDVSLSSTFAFIVYSITFMLMEHSEIIVSLGNSQTHEDQHAIPKLDQRSLDLTSFCQATDIWKYSSKTFDCPNISPKKSHKLTIWGLEQDHIVNVSMPMLYLYI